MKRSRNSGLAALAIVLAGGCAPAAIPAAPRAANAAPQAAPAVAPAAPAAVRESPPPSGPARAIRLPAVTWTELANGLRVATIPSKALPLVQLRLVVQAGKSADADRTGTAELTANLLEQGGAGGLPRREVATRIAALGARLTVDTDLDRTALGLAVTRDAMGDALAILGSLVRAPELDARALDALKRRSIDVALRQARSSGRWGAMMVLLDDLYALPTARHPYASYDATAADLEAVGIAEIRAFHRRFYVPKNMFVVVAGDTTPEAATAAAERAFGALRGGEAPVVSFTDPNPPKGLKVTLVDRPGSAQSDVYVGTLGPERADPAWSAVIAANQVLGGGAASRLDRDVREQRQLASSARSALIEVAHGPTAWVAHAATAAASTGLALDAVLANLDRMGSEAPTPHELEAARRQLADVTAMRFETIGDVADELAHLRTMGLADDSTEAVDRELLALPPEALTRAASHHLRPGHAVIVVAGDAAEVGPMLQRFGEVKIVDPARGFERVRTLPYHAGAPADGAAQGR